MATSGGPEAAAFTHFTNRDFDRAVEALQKVPQRLRGEARIQHNLAVAAFYRGGCVEIKRLVDALGALATAANAAEHPPGPGGAEDAAGGLGLATLSYNQAVLFYHLRRYSASLEILEGGLYRNVEALDEDLALRVCLLLVEVLLVLGQGAKAASVLLFVEKTFCSPAAATRSGASTSDDSTASNGGGSSSSSSTTPQRASSAASSSSADRPQLSLSLEQLQFVVHLYRARLQLLAKSANATKKELKQAGEALLLMQQQQQQIASSTSGTATGPGTGGPAGQLAFLKAHLEYTRRNYRKSLKLLNASQKRFSTNGDSSTTSSPSSSPPSPDALSAAYFNNMGCIHYQTAKYGAAAFYLAKAVRDDWSSTTEGSTTARTSRRCEMYYNQGIQLLVTGKPGVAFRCLLRAADTYHHQPRLWLRLAQCTIATHLAHERDAALRHQKSDAIARVAAHGGAKHRQVLLPDVASGVQPALTLRYGLECLRNALKLLEHNPEAAPATPATTVSGGGAAKPSATGAPAGPTDAASTAPSAAAAATAVGDSAGLSGAPAVASTTSLECVCLLSMAYIALALEDPVVALAAAGAALNVGARSTASAPNGTAASPTAAVIDDEHRLLAHLYAAEALCMLNRPAEAMQHLSPSLVKDLPASLPAGSSSSSSTGGGSSSATPAPGAFGPAPPTQFGLAPALASSARYVLYVNLAAAHILQDKLPQAQKCLLHATAIHPSSPHALLLQTYIELARGNTAAALDLLQRGKIVPPSASTASGGGGGSNATGQQQQDASGRSGPSFSAQSNNSK
ncbi:tetratricopeptide repeat-containing protein [Acanthamoeba castellanii str. Neff]|uniref:Tetratricopeptide repeat-containing protein n=1 Tax=Acanthamoeba castellanii (strain ATCC 30010 / Neff) TaxID=1257118 RepID=L8HDZ7_ACACF|nr:tetratricopeptide repeat-containing protein [Acanthamoeba castellanii str. Neff]ELR23420.1 tetratricopeptide repeat-containing protein [Acanthamoeba castellanii str. Neff]